MPSGYSYGLFSDNLAGYLLLHHSDSHPSFSMEEKGSVFLKETLRASESENPTSFEPAPSRGDIEKLLRGLDNILRAA